MKQINTLKIACVGAFVATLGVGCASSGYARYDADSTDMDQGMGASASADMGTDRDVVMVDRNDSTMTMTETEGEDRITVSALALNPETRATWVNRFPFYDSTRQLRTIDVYTFAVPDPGADYEVATRASDAPDFRADLPSGSVFVEAAGGAGEVRTGRIIQHSPNPTR